MIFSLRRTALAILFGTALLAVKTTRAQDTTTTTAGQNANLGQAEPGNPGVFLTFTHAHGIGPQPNATFGCSVSAPYVTTSNTGQTTWTATISCSTGVGLYGTTVLFNNNTQQIIAYGNQINTNSTSATSAGAYSGLHGTFQVNFNVDITPPPGYTTSAGGNCSYINGGPSVHCSVGSGAFTLR